MARSKYPRERYLCRTTSMLAQTSERKRPAADSGLRREGRNFEVAAGPV
jgi:hypothetical protein